MKKEELVVKMKDGSEKRGVVFVPETIDELVSLISPEDMFRSGVSAYLAKAKRLIATGGKRRRKLLILDLNALSDEQKLILSRAGLDRM